MTHFDDVVGVQHMEFDVDNYILMNLGTREQSWVYVPTGTICPMLVRKALGNYFGNIAEIVSLSDTNGKSQTVQSVIENNTGYKQMGPWMSSVMTFDLSLIIFKVLGIHKLVLYCIYVIYACIAYTNELDWKICM